MEVTSVSDVGHSSFDKVPNEVIISIDKVWTSEQRRRLLFWVLIDIIQHKPNDRILCMMKSCDIKADESDAVVEVGNTPLHYAALAGRSELTEMLLSGEGINANVLNHRVPYPTTPIYVAMLSNNAPIVRLLLKHGATVDSRLFHVMIHRSRCESTLISNDLSWMITREVARTGAGRKVDDSGTDVVITEMVFIEAASPAAAAAAAAAEQLLEQEFSHVSTARVRRWREAVAMQRRLLCVEVDIKECGEYSPWLQWSPSFETKQ